MDLTGRHPDRHRVDDGRVLREGQRGHEVRQTDLYGFIEGDMFVDRHTSFTVYFVGLRLHLSVDSVCNATALPCLSNANKVTT